VVAGGKIRVEVTLRGDTPAVFEVRSSDPSVMTGELVSQKLYTSPQLRNRDVIVLVQAAGEGFADLTLVDAGGQVIDGAPMTVKRPTRLAYTQGWLPADGPTVVSETGFHFHVSPIAEDEVLRGRGAITFDLEGPLVRLADLSYKDDDATIPGDILALYGQRGDGRIRAHYEDLEVVVSVHVVDVSDLTSLRIRPEVMVITNYNAPGLLGGTVTVKDQEDIEVHGEAAGAPVSGLACQWQLSSRDLSVGDGTLSSALGDGLSLYYPLKGIEPLGFLGAPAYTRYSLSGSPGQYLATCNVGDLHADISVQILPPTGS
jgi:hypothetical protein